MKRWISALILVSIVCTGGFAAKGPEVNLIDNKLSVNAEAISLSRLLQLVDLATGMKSKVPPELANRNISVKFSGLSVTAAVRKIFQGQPFDYVVVEGQGIIVTAASQTTPTTQTASGGDPAPAFNPPPAVQQAEQPFVQEFPPSQAPVIPQPPQAPQQQQPAMVQTPFGPIPNPRAQQQPNPPVAVPPQQNSLFAQPGQPFNQPNGQPTPAQEHNPAHRLLLEHQIRLGRRPSLRRTRTTDYLAPSRSSVRPALSASREGNRGQSPGVSQLRDH